MASVPPYTLVIGNRKYSSWSMRGWLACRLAGLNFAETMVPLDRPETPGLLAQQSPSGRVPCLIHGELAIWDSLAIAEYAAEIAPEARLWPGDPQDRALARSLVAEMHSGFTALRSELPMDMTRRHLHISPSAAADADIARLARLWTERLSASGGPYLFGKWSLADCFFAPVVSRFQTYGIAIGDTAQAYCEAVRAHPHYQEWLAGAEAEPWETPLAVLLGT